MSIKLYLLRHSYASSGANSDFNRSLTTEGLNTIRELGRLLHEKVDFNPSSIICSTALRTRETCQNLIEELGLNEKSVCYEEVIYNASLREMLGVINQVKKDIEELVLIGHNPTITYMAEFLTGDHVGNIDPCGIATIEFKQMNWSEISQNSGVLVSYFHPRQMNV